jgi:hypothetical protein
MILIKQQGSNVVLYTDDSSQLSPDSASGDGWADPKVNLSNSVLDYGTPPVTWIGGAYSFDKGAWSIVNQALIPVPQSITAFQAKAALVNAGLYAQVNTYMTTTAPALDQLAWAEAPSFQRTDTILNAMAAAIGLTSSQLDGLFIAGANISQ